MKRTRPRPVDVNDLLVCTFCGKNSAEVGKVIRGPGNGICNECIGLCVDICNDEGVSVRSRFTAPEHLTWRLDPTSRLLYSGHAEPGRLIATFDEPEDAVLAAAAPELLWIAKVLEWQECDDGTFLCAWCTGEKKTKAELGVHEDKCRLSATVKKATAPPLPMPRRSSP